MASLSRAVQLEKPDQVLEAYQNWQCPNFSIINGKQLLFAYDEENGTIEQGEEFLTWWCNRIYEKKSAAIYTLCIYKNLKGKEITNTTPYNGSVNFQFHEYRYDNPYSNNRYQDGPEIKLLTDKVSALTELVQRLQDEKGEDEPEEDATERFIGKASALLSNPVIAGLIGNLFGSSQQALQQPVQPEQGKVTRIAGAALSEDDNRVIAESLEVLKKRTKNLPIVLSKLAALAEKKPTQFKFYETMLLKMKL